MCRNRPMAWVCSLGRSRFSPAAKKEHQLNALIYNSQITISTPCDCSFVLIRASGYAATWPQQLLKVPKARRYMAGGEMPSSMYLER